MTDNADVAQLALTEFEDTRGLRYAELFAVGAEWINVYNSTGLSEAPPELWDATDAAAAAEQLGANVVVKNGPHWWVFDSASLKFASDSTDVQGIGYRFCAKLPAFLAKSGSLEPPFYTVVEANKEGELRYTAGKPVYELVSPDGEAFVMQGSAVDPARYDTLGKDLDIAEGWQFRTRVLEEDLTVPLDGKVGVVMDNFKNVYNRPAKARAPHDDGPAKALDVMIAVYPGPTQAQHDFEAFLAKVEQGSVTTEGVVLVTRDDNGQVSVQETGDHVGRKGAKVGGGVGLVVGLFSPPLLAATVVGAAGGALVGKFAKKRVAGGIGKSMDEALPAGAAGIIAVYSHEQAAEVDAALSGAFTKSVAGMDHADAKDLKAGLKEAQEGL